MNNVLKFNYFYLFFLKFGLMLISFILINFRRLYCIVFRIVLIFLGLFMLGYLGVGVYRGLILSLGINYRVNDIYLIYCFSLYNVLG